MSIVLVDALAQKQKSELVESSRAYYYLRFYAKQLNDCCEGKNFLHIEVLGNTRELLKNVTVVMNQCKIILNSCPLEDNFISDVFEVSVLESEIKDRIEYKNDAVWSRAMNLISDVLTAANKLNSVLQKCQGNVPSVEYDLACPEFVPISDLRNVETDLIGIYKNIDNLKQIFGNVDLSNSLTWLMKEIGIIGQQFEKQYLEEVTYNLDEFKKEIEKFAEKNLIIMQNLYKKIRNYNN
ncbi:hypothetical protein NQ314_017613 [Rhamnusium bicolor]|uniref:Uncharacterized protein n=1 Tax=Rhamnusium bicolor TaxID=1586634 RepID=A0AAV8WTA7_9CUCU|nr:hypothetical protein NQ314_017613 [Rhamnusium bicolor]